MNENIFAKANALEEGKALPQDNPYFDSENIRFQSHLIEPKIQDQLPLLIRDNVLANIKEGIADQIDDRESLALELQAFHFYGAAQLIENDCKVKQINSRGIGGFQQTMLVKAIIERNDKASEVQAQKMEEEKKRKGLFDWFRKK
jgi:hypothetical protein